MSPPRAKQAPDPVSAKLDEVARLLALLLKRDRPMTEAITELSSVGFGQNRISELVGTSAGYVDNVIAKDKRQKRSSGRRTSPKRTSTKARRSDGKGS